MLKVKNLKIPAFIFTLIILMGLCACFSKTSTQSESLSELNIISEGKSEYRIVCSYNADHAIIDAALSLANGAKNKTGAELEVVSDRNVPFNEAVKEIIIGNTDRSLPDFISSLSPMEYAIAENEGNIYISGGSDSATVIAIEYFTENIIIDPTIIKKDFLYKYNLPYTSFNLNSTSISEISINDFEGVDKTKVAEALRQKADIAVSETQEATKLFFELDYSLKNNTVRFKEKDDAIVISASSKIALTQIDEVILNNFGEYSSLNLDHGSFIDFTYPMLSINDIENQSECYFACETNKSPLEYTTGEEMIFTLSLKYDGETVSAPMFSYRIEFDGEKENIIEQASGETGSLEIKTSIDNPGFVKIYANATSDLGIELRDIPPFEGGACAGISEIWQSATEPDDFDEFWQNELEKLDKVAPVMTVKEDISEKFPGYTVLDIRIDCIDDPVSGYLSIPDNALAGSLPILVGYTGYGVVSPEPTVRSDRIVFTVNAHSLDNGREIGYYNEIASSILYSYGFSDYENSSRDTVYFKNMILRDVQAIRYLKTLEEWDGEGIILNGGSQGAYQCLAVAALEDDVTYVFAAYPWLCDLAGDSANRISGWRPTHTDALNYYDAVNFAKRIKCQTRIVAGLGDYVAPPSGVVAMTNSMNCPLTVEFTQGMTHYYTPPNPSVYTLTK